ncbi:MAG: methyltransferase [Clostridia bacterium]|nr:methyltransferase [Clostridia bacterium]
MKSEEVRDVPKERIDVINDGLTLSQHKEHLNFGTDALLLAAYIQKADKGAELGAGNGIISLLCASRKKLAHIDAWEIQPAVAELCQKNVLENGLTDVITVKNEDLRDARGEIEGSYRAVFTNPPYMKVHAGKDCQSPQKQIARHEVAGDIFDFCRSASRLLCFGGDFYCVYRPDRLVDLLSAMREADLEPKILTTVCESPAHAPCMVLVKGKKGGKAGLYCSPVFFISNGREKTADYQYVLEHGSFPLRFQKP